jgi:TM2 domain-containing membrane protein YozV
MKVKNSVSTGTETHATSLGYVLWFFGFMGAHRFYYGKSWTATLYFFTFGFFLIGWVVDFFLIPGMEREAAIRYQEGNYNYNVSWILLVFFGVFGAHRFYLGKWPSGIIWLLTGGFFLIGYLYDLWNLNEMVDERNRLT